MVLLYCILLVDIHSSHIIGPATTKLRGIVVMTLGWHAERSMVQTPSGPLETFASQLLDALYRVKLKAEKKAREKF